MSYFLKFVTVNNILLVGLPGTGIGHKLAVLYNNDF